MPTLIKEHRPDVVFNCVPCEFRTSGAIFLEINPRKRFCLRCKANLVWCQTCSKYTSARKEETNPDNVVCDTCCSVIPEDHQNISKPKKEASNE